MTKPVIGNSVLIFVDAEGGHVKGTVSDIQHIDVHPIEALMSGLDIDQLEENGWKLEQFRLTDVEFFELEGEHLAAGHHLLEEVGYIPVTFDPENGDKVL